MLGLENNEVKLIDYADEWNEVNSLEKNRLQKQLGDNIVNIQHIGSTSIQGMSAKPIIDILVSIENKELFYSAVTPLYDLGYRFLGNGGRRGILRDNLDIKEGITDKYFRVYITKSLFLQTYMDDFILRGGIGFAREVLYRVNDFYSDIGEKIFPSLNNIVEHLNSKFTDKELEIMYEERKKCFKENIKIWDVVNNFSNKN